MPTGIYKRIKGKNCGLNKGKHWNLSERIKKRMSPIMIKVWQNPKHRKKVSEALKGKEPKNLKYLHSLPRTKERNERVRESKKGIHTSIKTEFQKGKNHPNWKGGSSFEPYGIEFNKELKQQIRERDNHTDQLTGLYGNIVHHIDYDKKNNHPSNLITLSNSSNSKVNFNREYWTNYFKLCAQSL